MIIQIVRFGHYFGNGQNLEFRNRVSEVKSNLKSLYRPFWNRLSGDKKLFGNVTLGKCRRDFEIALDQHLEILKTYNGSRVPLFLYSWLTQLAHDNNNNLFWADHYFLDYFKKAKPFYGNTVLFFLSDHGSRFGAVRNAGEIGRLEHDKPFITLTIPKRLRQQQIIRNFEANSKVLTTHYDVHATLMDLLTLDNHFDQDFSNPRPDETNAGRGYSLLGPREARSRQAASALSLNRLLYGSLLENRKTRMLVFSS